MAQPINRYHLYDDMHCLNCHSRACQFRDFDWEVRPRYKDQDQTIYHEILQVPLCDYCYNYTTYDGTDIPQLWGWNAWDAAEGLDFAGWDEEDTEEIDERILP